MVYLFILGILLSIVSSWFILWKVPVISSRAQKIITQKKLSILIPARNEEENLPILLTSLKKQNIQPFEVIVVDDDSEDETAEIAKANGAHVTNFPAHQTDWVGKAAACYHGAREAEGDLFLFLDADVYLPESSSLENIIREYQASETVSVLSIQPYHVIEQFYENLSVVFNLLVLVGMNRFSFLEEKLQPAGAFGPSLLIDRETYFNIDGHKRAHGSIMENIDLGKVLLEEGTPVDLYGGKRSLHFRMYADGYRSLAEGWSKSFVSGSKSTRPLILFGISLWIAGAFLAPAFVIYSCLQGSLSLLAFSIVSYLLYYLQFLRMTKKAGNFSSWAMLLYPGFIIYFVLLFAWSAIQTKFLKRVSWKGRKINIKEETHGD